MGTVTKSIRVDEDFLSIVEEYNKLVKDMFGAAPTVNGVLASAIVKGFADNLQLFKAMRYGMFKVDPASLKPGESWNTELAERANALVDKYERYEIEFDTKEE